MATSSTSSRFMVSVTGRTRGLSGKGLARCRAVRFQPLPIRTAREVFPQAAHPASFVERVMNPVFRRPLSLPLPNARQWLDLPVPVQPQNVVEVFVTPSPPADTRLSPPLSPRQQSPDFHLHVVANLAKGTTCVANPKVVDPPSQRSVDPFHQFGHRGCSPACDDVTNLRLDGLAGLLLRSHQDKMPISA